MQKSQFKNSGFLFLGQLMIKGSSFIKQLLMAFFLGISANIDILLIAQIAPAILASMIAGGAGEILVTSQKKDKKYDETFVVLFVSVVLLITIMLNSIYFLTLPLFAKLFMVDADKMQLFVSLSVIVVISKIPAAMVSSLQHLLFSKSKYKFYVISSLTAEALGIITIVLLVDQYQILSFAIGLLVSSTANALLFMYALNLKFSNIFQIHLWQEKLVELKEIMKKVINLSGQTLLNQLSTFWERTLSSRYLQPGFLGALNYSKSLTELPKMAMLSSILTTTYIEQVNKKAESEESYVQYTHKMEKLLSQLAFGFQILSIVFGPLLILIFYKRGQFDNHAVDLTFSIYQILTLGFVPNLMLNFLSRTMYIEGEYRKLFRIIAINFIIECALMFGLIQIYSFAIPAAIVFGKFFVSIALFIVLYKKRPEMLDAKYFVKLYILLFASTLGILILNQWVITFLLDKTTFEIILIYSPVVLIFAFIGIFLIKKFNLTEFKAFRRFFKKTKTV
jgi:putative peptidoglycan lipid II flippase